MKIVQEYWFQSNWFVTPQYGLLKVRKPYLAFVLPPHPGWPRVQSLAFLDRPAGLWQNRDMTARWTRFLVMIAIGIGLGLLYGWVIEPVQYVDTAPDSLRLDYKTDYVLMVAEAYQVEHDLNLAVQRLSLLGGTPTEPVAVAIAFAQNPELPPSSSVHALLIQIGAVEPLRAERYASIDIQLMQALAEALRTLAHREPEPAVLTPSLWKSGA